MTDTYPSNLDSDEVHGALDFSSSPFLVGLFVDLNVLIVLLHEVGDDLRVVHVDVFDL